MELLIGWMIYPLAFLVTLGVLVIFHEYGHFQVARWCGVKVLRFSVGFGKVIWRRHVGETQWVVSALPLGGYVKMLDEREEEVPSEDVHRAFNRQSLTRRSLIVAAGPVANFLLAALVYAFLFWWGTQELLPLLDTPKAGSPAETAGIQRGDEVRRVDGLQVATWEDLRWGLLQKAADQPKVQLTLADRSQRLRTVQLPLDSVRKQRWEGDVLGYLGVRLYFPRLRPVLEKISPNGPAKQAGLQPGDEIVAINGEPLDEWLTAVKQIQHSANEPLTLKIRRQSMTLISTLTPRPAKVDGRIIGRIGVTVRPGLAEGERPVRRLVSYGPVDSLYRGVQATWSQTRFTLVMIGRMLTGEVSLKNISGLVTIADYAGKTAQMGWVVYLKFLALLSIGLGVINLLPIPVLDGGHLLYHTIEAIWRRPLPEGLLMFGQRLGMALLMALMIFAIFNDILRLSSN